MDPNWQRITELLMVSKILDVNNLADVAAFGKKVDASFLAVMAALLNPSAWDAVVPHSSLSSETKAELFDKLEEARNGAISLLREGNLDAAEPAVRIAIQQATLR